MPWTDLLVNHFGNPDWLTLYPLAEGSLREDADGQTWGTPKGLIPPRTACKLFHDGVYILNKTDEAVKFMQVTKKEEKIVALPDFLCRPFFLTACNPFLCLLIFSLSLVEYHNFLPFLFLSLPRTVSLKCVTNNLRKSNGANNSSKLAVVYAVVLLLDSVLNQIVLPRMFSSMPY